MKNTLCILSLLFCFASSSIFAQIAEEPSSDFFEHTLMHQEVERAYDIHLPPAYAHSSPLPVLIVLHGRFGQTKKIMEFTGLNALADKENFIAVYPKGTKSTWADHRNSTPASEMNRDDVGFISGMIDDIGTKYRIDVNRVYVSGMSNGGFMALTLACEIPEKIAAVAAIGASLPSPIPTCEAKVPLPVMLMNGTADMMIPYEGGKTKIKNGGRVISTDSTMAFFSAVNGCGSYTTEELPDSVPGDSTTIRKRSWDNCDSGNKLVLYEIVNGGHTWPGKPKYLRSSWIGNSSEEMDGNVAIWNFCSQFSKNVREEEGN